MILTALTAALALAACGGGGSSSSSASATATSGAAKGGGGGQTVKVAADPSGAFKFMPGKLTAKAGLDTFEFTNDSPLGHNFTIENESGKSLGSTPTFTGGSKSVNLTLQPGTYKFLCTVPGHAQGGMEGTLTVK